MNVADYDAPVAENGDLTEKYFIIQKVLHEMLPNPEGLLCHVQGLKRQEKCRGLSRICLWATIIRTVVLLETKDLSLAGPKCTHIPVLNVENSLNHCPSCCLRVTAPHCGSYPTLTVKPLVSASVSLVHVFICYVLLSVSVCGRCC